MDIGNQQRVIIVELDPVSAGQPTPVETTAVEERAFEMAAAWPLPLDLDPERVS
ncbi:MAG: hypothetical protein GY722_24700 [bacterium]|nr:hypothetical protein [bacterium]